MSVPEMSRSGPANDLASTRGLRAGSRRAAKRLGTVVREHGVRLAAAVALVVALGSAAIYLPRQIAQSDCGDACDDAGQLAKAISDSRTAFLQFLVAVAGGATVYFTWKNYTRSLREAEVNVGLAREGRTSDNFIKAVEQLGSDKPAVRAGGVFGLGRLLQTAKPGGDYWPIMDVLTTFIRDQAPLKDPPHIWKPSEDVQAALNVLARRSATNFPERTEDSPVDVHHTDLKEAWMAGGNFQRGFFGSTRLVEADLSCANLDRADMPDADLTCADLRNASIQNADLARCCFRDAKLNRANLRGSILDAADFSGADLTEVELHGADLRQAQVTAAQLAVARGDVHTKLPPAVARPASWSSS
jgi:hypothetical protein